MKNQLRSGVVLSYLQIALNMLIQLLYTPIMMQQLGRSEYGLYTLVGSFVSCLGLLSFGATGAYLRFYMRLKKEKNNDAIARMNGMFLCLFLLMSVTAVVSGVILAQFTPEIFGNKLTPEELSRAETLMYILVFNLALTFPSSVFDSIVSAHEQFIFQRVINLLSIIFNPLICLPLLFMGYGSVMITTVTLSISLVKLIVNALYCIKKLKAPFAFRNFDYGLLREIFLFSSFIFLNMIIDQVNWSIDKYILGRISGTDEVAVYGVSAVINTAFIAFSTAISSVFAPKINMIAAEKGSDMTKKFNELFIGVGRLQFAVMSLAATGFIFFGKYFITDIYVTPEYENAYYAALFLILPAMVPLIQNTGLEIQRAVNKHRFRSAVYMVMAFINLSISIPLSKNFGCVGAAAGTAVGLILANGIIMNIYYSKALDIDIAGFWKSVARLSVGLAIPVLSGIMIMRFVQFRGTVHFLMWAALYVVIYIFSFLLLGISKKERDMLSGYLRR